MRFLKDKTDWPKIGVYDIEATQWVNVKLICHLDEYGNKVHFRTIAEYIDFLFSKTFKGSHIWAHAGGRYDHRFLIPEFYARGWDFKASLTGGSIVILTVKDDKNRRLQFCDSYRLMPSALADIGKTIGLPKLDVDRGHMEDMPWDDMVTYCYRDCEIVLKGLQYMRDVTQSVGADFACTLASLATRYVRRSPVIDHNRFYRPTRDGSGIEYDPKMLFADAWCLGADPPDNDVEYTAYHGGRTEMFAQGTIKGPIYYYDVVSSYPWSMTQELPLYLQGFYPPPKDPSESQKLRFLAYSGITEAWVYIPSTHVGPLPFQQDKKPLVFPTGAIQGRFTNLELVAAIQRGCKVELGWQCRFEPKAFLKPFVTTFYNLRKKAKADKDEFRSYAFKILLNSLYGKTVETIDRTSYTTSREEMDRIKELGGTYSATKIAGLYQTQSQEEGPFRHVAAGSYITAYSRQRLLEGMEYVLAKGGKVLYCDTDSIMSTIPIPELQGEELGQWQPEYVFSEVEILQPKVYRAVISQHKDAKKIGTTLYRCKGLPIVRDKEPTETSEARWNAFKTYTALDPNDPQRASLAQLLSKDGISGFVADMNSGRISPIRQPLLRARQSNDRKRDWSAEPSMPLQKDLPRHLKRVRS